MNTTPQNSNSWDERPLSYFTSDIIDYRGKTPPRADSGIPVITAAHVKAGRVVHCGEKFVSQKVYDRWTTRRFIKPGDVLITTEAPVGQVALVPGDRTYLITRRVIALQIDPARGNEHFIKYLLLSDYTRRRFETMSHGTTVPRLYKEDILDLAVPVPPLPAQHKIAGVLRAYDDLIENNRRRVEVLEEMARLIYREWFVKFRFPGHEKVKLVASPLGKIPEGWEAFTLAEVAVQERRGVKATEVAPTTPYVGLEHIPRRSLTVSEWGDASDITSSKYAFHRGEILFGKIRPYFHKVCLAPISGICSTDAIVICPLEKRFSQIVLCCVSSDHFVEHATQTSNGTKMPRANWTVLLKYPVALPPKPLLKRFNRMMSDMVGLIENLTLRNRKMRRTRDLLLPRLISGEIDVSDLDINVPEGVA